MLYPKQCVSGKPINLTEYELGIIKQPKVDVFMDDYDINDFIKPFYIEQTLFLDEKINKLNAPLSILVEVTKSDGVFFDLIQALQVLYETQEIKLMTSEEGYALLIKRDGKGYANITDKNFHKLSDVVFEIMKYDKPEPEPKYEGDPDLIKKVKEAEAKRRARKLKDDVLTLEMMVHNVIHLKNLTYEIVKDWTIWQIKDTYMVEILKENKNFSYLLASGGHYKVELKKVKDWKKETRVLDDNLLSQND